MSVQAVVLSPVWLSGLVKAFVISVLGFVQPCSMFMLGQVLFGIKIFNKTTDEKKKKKVTSTYIITFSHIYFHFTDGRIS